MGPCFRLAKRDQRAGGNGVFYMWTAAAMPGDARILVAGILKSNMKPAKRKK